MTWSNSPTAPAPGTVLCALADLADGVGTGFDIAGTGASRPFRLFVVRRGGRIWAYVNACAHFGIELNPGRGHTFLSPDGSAIRCQHHGALYAFDDGRCLKGDCDGEGLTAVPVAVRDGLVVITGIGEPRS